MAPKKTGMSDDTKMALEVGAGIAAAAAAAGATYWFYGSQDAKKHRKAATKWAKGMKDDVLKEAKKIKNLDQKAMTAVVNRVADAYADVRSVDKADLTAAARELKKNWRKIQEEVSGTAKKTASKATKKAATATKKTAKTVKKSAKKRST